MWDPDRPSTLFSTCLWGSLRWSVAACRFKINWGGGKMQKLWLKSCLTLAEKDLFWHLSKACEKWAWQDPWNQMKKWNKLLRLMSCHSQWSAKHVMSQWKIILIDTRLFVRVYIVQEPEQRETTQAVLLIV